MPEREAWGVFLSHKREALIFAVLAALIEAAWIAWFWIPDRTTLAVLLSLFGGILALVATAWWLGAVSRFYGSADTPALASAMKESARRIPLLLVCTLVGVLLAMALPALLAWMVVPLLLLPVAVNVARDGLGGFRTNPWPPRYFLSVVGALVAGGILPYLLWQWHPSLPGLGMQTASATLRFLIGYALVISTLLILASVLGRLHARRMLS